ncbi:hypothetical protein TI39_contig442g00002 [Zymoseptoria brevis]|uniref:F-box domain-containing protein n=1 Tax=Zymoseptoria brevis TaxID=1047168 RepID=A0A0F4GLE1_9PEZI|nr:hypothetical protein TI39_contig442g00002 [Zymoseptoria brevis]
MEPITTTARPCAALQPRTPPASLLTLPRELRDIILDYLILKPKNTITMLPNFNCHTNEVSARAPAICAVSKQLRSEALPAFYANNTFLAQLDNDEDLETAIHWLSAIGDENIAHLRRLAMCGWTRVPFGHMVSRRWVTIVLDLNLGTMELESLEGKYGIDEAVDGMRGTMDELGVAYRAAVRAKDGKAFDGEMLGDLMSGFNMLCTGY